MSKKEFHPAAWSANVLWKKVAEATEFVDFHATVTNAIMRLNSVKMDEVGALLASLPVTIPAEAKEALVKILFSINRDMGNIMAQCYGQAHVVAGEGAAFPTFRATFMDLLDKELRRMAEMYHPDEERRSAQHAKNKTEGVAGEYQHRAEGTVH